MGVDLEPASGLQSPDGKCMRVWVSEPRAHYGLAINPLRGNVGWARLALAWVPCAGPVSWWRYHLMAVDQAFIGGFE